MWGRGWTKEGRRSTRRGEIVNDALVRGDEVEPVGMVSVHEVSGVVSTSNIYYVVDGVWVVPIHSDDDVLSQATVMVRSRVDFWSRCTNTCVCSVEGVTRRKWISLCSIVLHNFLLKNLQGGVVGS